MIARLLHYCSPRGRRLVITELALVVVAAVLQGIAFLLLVPLLRALFTGDMDAARGWLFALAAAAVGYVVASWFASQVGMEASTEVLQSLLERLGDSVVSLPVAWFSTDRSGLITGIATQGAMFVSTMPYAVLRQILAGFVAPATVLVGMYAFDWRLALSMTVMVPIIALGYLWLGRGIGRGDRAHSAAVAEASNRVVEFARIQPTLRTAGEGSVADQLVASALAILPLAAAVMYLCGWVLPLVAPSPLVTVISIACGYLIRFVAAAGVGAHVIATTSPTQLSAALRAWRLPRALSVTLAVMLRFFPVVVSESLAVLDAMRLRGLVGARGIARHPILAMERFTVPMIAASLRASEDLSASAILRGLGSRRVPISLDPPRFGRRDLLLAVAVAVILAVSPLVPHIFETYSA